MGGGNRVAGKACTHRFELLLLPISVGAEHLTRRVNVVEAPAHGGAGRMLVGAPRFDSTRRNVGWRRRWSS